jgi:hypothetical protein
VVGGFFTSVSFHPDSISAHSVSESLFPKFSFNAQRPRLGWSAKIADCHLSGFGSPPNADQLIAIEKS